MATTAELLDRFVALFNAGKFEEAENDYAQHGVFYETGTNRRMTPHEATQSAREWKAAFPDATGKITNKLVAGNVGAAEVVWTGTHRGPLKGLPATNKSVTVYASVWIEADGGKIVRGAHYLDLPGMMAQLGVGPGVPSRA